MAEIDDEQFNQLVYEIDIEEKKEETPKKEEVTDVTKSAEGVEEHDSQKKESTEEKIEPSADAEYYPHIGIMEAENIDRKELPKEVQAMITMFNRKKHMAEVRKAKDETFLQIRNLSVIIADRILDWLERDVENPAAEKEEEIEEVIVEKTEPKEEEIEEVIEDEFEEEGENKEKKGDDNKKGGMFEGVLGGIFDW